MPSTFTDIVELLKAKGTFWPPWMISEPGWMTGMDPDNRDSYEDQWEDWILSAEASWLPALFAIALNPPVIVTEYGGVTPEEWIYTVGDVLRAIAIVSPHSVVNALLEALDESSESGDFLYLFGRVADGVRVAFGVPGGPDAEVGISLIDKLLDSLSRLVASVSDRSDQYVMCLVQAIGGRVSGPQQQESVDPLAERLRHRAHGLLRQIDAIVSLDRVDVHKRVNNFLNPSPKP